MNNETSEISGWGWGEDLSSSAFLSQTQRAAAAAVEANKKEQKTFVPSIPKYKLGSRDNIIHKIVPPLQEVQNGLQGLSVTSIVFDSGENQARKYSGEKILGNTKRASSARLPTKRTTMGAVVPSEPKLSSPQVPLMNIDLTRYKLGSRENVIPPLQDVQNGLQGLAGTSIVFDSGEIQVRKYSGEKILGNTNRASSARLPTKQTTKRAMGAVAPSEPKLSSPQTARDGPQVPFNIDWRVFKDSFVSKVDIVTDVLPGAIPRNQVRVGCWLPSTQNTIIGLRSPEPCPSPEGKRLQWPSRTSSYVNLSIIGSGGVESARNSNGTSHESGESLDKEKKHLEVKVEQMPMSITVNVSHPAHLASSPSPRPTRPATANANLNHKAATRKSPRTACSVESVLRTHFQSDRPSSGTALSLDSRFRNHSAGDSEPLAELGIFTPLMTRRARSAQRRPLSGRPEASLYTAVFIHIWFLHSYSFGDTL
jgi:hypothetical protein